MMSRRLGLNGEGCRRTVSCMIEIWKRSASPAARSRFVQLLSVRGQERTASNSCAMVGTALHFYFGGRGGGLVQ